jgi:hypothetical protein
VVAGHDPATFLKHKRRVDRHRRRAAIDIDRPFRYRAGADRKVVPHSSVLEHMGRTGHASFNDKSRRPQ